jgi:signal peptidase I
MSARKVHHTRTWRTPQWLMSAAFLMLLGGPTIWLARSVRVAKVPSGSMEPTFIPGDILSVRIDAYRRARPKHGDVIIFQDPKDGWLVKRVIGIPGDRLVVFSGRVSVNGQWVEEPYVEPSEILEYPQRLTLGEDQYWVMGDNRDHAKDSRDFGPVKFSQVVGQVNAILFPWARRGGLTSYSDVFPAPSR